MIKLGFACMRYPQPEHFRVGHSTMTHLRSLKRSDAIQKLEAIALQNSENVYNLVCSVAQDPEYFRMVRIGGEVWAGYDTEFGNYDVTDSIKWLHRARKVARDAGVRLSFHPAQFNALASDKKHVVDATIKCLNIYGEIGKHLGVTEINIHCWGKTGVKGFIANAKYLTAATRKRLTVENDEFGVGLYALENIGFPIVLDTHHHWVNTGEWPRNTEFQLARESWTDRRPKMHYSYPRNCTMTRDWPILEGSRTKARAHSDTYNNETLNKWIIKKALQFDMDIMCEAKMKDVARDRLFQTYIKHWGVPK